ncbi:MAG: VCBS repeat-containing protein [Thermodesulfobacteriota bacterium]|nr:VCBS repeat-containing protein [Thermodesulfobacteriota bacterium]
MRQKKISVLSMIILFGAIFMWLLPSFAKEPKKLAILPFTMNADRDLTFLQEGIMDMLAARLAWKGEVDVLEKGIVKKKAAGFKGPLNREKAIVIGKALQVEFVIIGSLTVFGESVSIDCRIINVPKSEELVTAFNQTKGMDEVIPTINQFAQDINSKILGRAIVPPRYVLAPEYRSGRESKTGLIKVEDRFDKGSQGHRSRYRTEIIGMDVGDVDGDGKNEMVFIDPETVYVYKWVDGNFAQINKLKNVIWSPNFISLDVADLDGNGKAEIYISNLTLGGVGSLVLEWKGKRLALLIKGAKWLIRVIEHPSRGKILIGQKRAATGNLLPGVHVLMRQSGKLVDSGVLQLSHRANVFNFALGDVVGTGGQGDTILLSKLDHLFLMDGQGEELWRGDEKFGGSFVFIPDFSGGEEGVNHKYLPPRIFLSDIDSDGRKEVTICQNKEKLGRLLDRVRSFKNGRVFFLTWDGGGLNPAWKTQKLSGCVTDYQIKDVDNDDQLELVVSVVTREYTGAIRLITKKKAKSQIIVYDLKS